MPGLQRPAARGTHATQVIRQPCDGTRARCHAHGAICRGAIKSQRPPAKPEACRRVSGSKPHGPSGDGRTHEPNRTSPLMSPSHANRSRVRRIRLDVHSPKSCCLFRPSPNLPPTHIPGTVKLWEPLRQSRRVSRWTKGMKRQPDWLSGEGMRSHLSSALLLAATLADCTGAPALRVVKTASTGTPVAWFLRHSIKLWLHGETACM